jgi:hypothetical protein
MKGGFASKNNIEVYDSPDLKMRSKQSYRSRSELRRPESERVPSEQERLRSERGERIRSERSERIKSERGERIKSERSEQMTSEVSYVNDFDERDEADLDADVELYTDDIKSSQDVASVSQKSLKSRNSRNRSSMSRRSSFKGEFLQDEARRSSLRSSGQDEMSQSKLSQRSRSQKSRRSSSFKEPSMEQDLQGQLSRRESIRSGVVDSGMPFEDEDQIGEDYDRSHRGSLQMEDAENIRSRRGSLRQENSKIRSGSIGSLTRENVERISRKGSLLEDADNIRSRRGSLLHDDIAKSREFRRASLRSKSSASDMYKELESEEEIEDDFQRTVLSRGKSQVSKRSRDNDLNGGRQTAPPHYKQV